MKELFSREIEWQSFQRKPLKHLSLKCLSYDINALAMFIPNDCAFELVFTENIIYLLKIDTSIKCGSTNITVQEGI